MGTGLPSPQGLYDPRYEHDGCGVGFIVDLKGRKSHQLVRDGLTALVNLDHRGACGCENNTGDGAGILIQVPHEFLVSRCQALGIALGAPESYGVGHFFASPDPAQQQFGKEIFESIVAEEGQVFLGWRPVKTDNAPLGASARGRAQDVPRPGGKGTGDPRCGCLRAQALRDPQAVRVEIEESGLDDHKYFYFSSLSCRTLVYKGMLTPGQVGVYLRRRPGRSAAPKRDLHVPFAVLHQYVSELATGPSLPHDLAQRRDQHPARQHQLDAGAEALFASELYEPGDVEKIKPIIREGLSDTACLDNAIELLVRSGYSLAHAMMMLIPEAWENHETMSQVKKDFYPYHSCLMEPWDGPASVDLHRRQEHRRRARPQRSAPQPLRRHQGRSRDHGVGGRRLEIAPEDIVQKGTAGAGQDVSGRPRAGPDRRRRRAQGEDQPRRSPTASGCASTWCLWPIFRRRPTSPAPIHERCSSGSRPSAIPSKISSTSWGRWAQAARKRSARWARIRRWRCFPTVPSRCSTTSSSSSPR